jgi:hypothetical protein
MAIVETMDVPLNRLITSFAAFGIDRPHGLRENDLEELPALGDAQRRGRLRLTGIHRDDAGPDDLRGQCGPD